MGVYVMERIKLVVLNENILGYITPEQPNYVSVLHASILKGATYPNHCGPYLLGSSDKTRLASEKDFNDFRVSFQGYDNLTEIYEFKS